MAPSTTTARHQELLDQLLALYLAEGFATFTLSDLAVRLHCSKSTLYALGHSKEAVTTNVLKRFFQGATQRIEAHAAAPSDPAEQLVAYLRAVADELRAASPPFMRDIAAHPAARAVYEKNTRIAAARVRELIADGVERGGFRRVHGAFVADVVASVMVRIQSGEVERAVGLHDADAYDELAALVISGIATP
ncbi:MAG: regulatory protein TetR [Solirubrobacterales bacterium]|nr:regulatory protein TetR [Solirubrobacterales bacterium]